jgi:basic amino acid/polyamine antiporter, APA family
MTEPARDAGLLRAVGPLTLAASCVNIVVASGIFVLPAAMAAAVGGYAPLALLACAVATAAIVTCFAAGGRRVATSGGPYGYIRSAFGPLAGCAAGTLMWVSNVLACAAIAAALGAAASSIAPPSVTDTVRVFVILGVLALVAAVNVAGVAWGARFVAVATPLKLVPLLLFLAVGLANFPAGVHASAGAPAMQGFGRAMILGIFAFSGFEIPLIASGEVAQPRRTIPLALGLALGFVTLLYVSIQVVAQRMLGSGLATSPAPLADAMAKVHPALQALLLVGAFLSMFAYLGSDVLGTPRMLFAFARDGMLPGILGRLHPRTHAPFVAILSYTAIAAVLALTGTFAELVVMSALASALMYIGSCAAVWVLARRGSASFAATRASPWLAAAAIIGIASMVMMIVLASWAEIGGLAVMLALSGLAYGVRLLRLKPAAAP